MESIKYVNIRNRTNYQIFYQKINIKFHKRIRFYKNHQIKSKIIKIKDKMFSKTQFSRKFIRIKR
jgi:hypothetical protein